MRMSSRLAAQVRPSYLIYDLETSELDPTGQIFQFAAIRLDLELNEIERFNYRIRLDPDVIPHPEAMLVTRTTPAQLEQGITLYEALHGITDEDGNTVVKGIYAIMNQPGTINIGYNSFAFDEEFIRFAFFRHLLPSYRHQFVSHCSRMDLYPMVIMARLFQDNLLAWPMSDSKPTFKLEALARANQLTGFGQSHDALTDVLHTVEITRRLHANRDFWEVAKIHFDKKWDKDQIDNASQKLIVNDHAYTLGFLMDTIPLQPLFPVVCLGAHRSYENQTRWLRLDSVAFRDCARDNIMQQVRVVKKKYGEHPFYFLPDNPLCLDKFDEAATQRVQDNLDFLEQNPDIFEQIVQTYLNAKYPENDQRDPDAALYKISFPADADEFRFQQFHLVSDARKSEVAATFSNPVHHAIAVRVMGRYFPDALADDDARAYNDYIRRVFSNDPADAIVDYRGKQRLTVRDAIMKVDELLRSRQSRDEQERLLELRAWYQRLQHPDVLRSKMRVGVVQRPLLSRSPTLMAARLPAAGNDAVAQAAVIDDDDEKLLLM